MKQIVGLIACGLVLAACSGSAKKADPPYGISAETPEGAAMVAFFEGDTETAAKKAAAADRSAQARFARAEIAYGAGDVEAAYTEWVALLTDHPADPLARIAAARLYSVRDEVVEFEDRVLPIFDQLEYGKLEPLTKVYVGLLHQTVAYRLWQRSTTAAPFDADKFGFPAQWLATPSMSPWRLRDFDVVFSPEEEPHFGPKYLSPHTATDVEQNWDETTAYWTTGITLYPSVSGTGLYYLETFATVTGKEARDYWLYGNFVAASKVWIDGTLVLDRRETNYETGKRLRKIRLTPGTHRVLVKMAYQTGYRDWFDMMFVPVQGPVDESGIDFAFGCLPDRKLPNCHDGGPTDGARVILKSEPKLPSDLEPVLVTPNDVAKATDVGLWVTMLAAHHDGENEFFAPAWKELEGRRPKFAAGHALYADHVQTLWQVPSKLRDARGLKALRHAYEVDPESSRYAMNLGRWLTKQGDDREARRLLAEARDRAKTPQGRLRAVEPLAAWAAMLSDKNWETEAEKAWREVLAAEPGNCRAASEIQRALYARGDYKAPPEVTPGHTKCPDLEETWIEHHTNDYQGRLELARREAARAPLRGDYARRLARLLWQLEKGSEAEKVIARGLEVDPDSSSLWAERADRLFAAGKEAAAIALLREYRAKHGNSAWLEWKLALMSGEIPLGDIKPDGHTAAMKVVKEGQDRSLSNDEAYFAVDFAARRYFPDGSKITLTHTVVRVMTKGAIDRYGEQNVPGNARIVLARTIKQDGSVRVPEQTAGKSTLSMPGLAEGDFVEMAYLEYDGPNTPAAQIEGVRFFFRMRDISTLHSEYVVIGDIADFMRYNDAPKMERFEYQGLPAVRFSARDNPRPRDEPRTVSIEEYLPWVQMYRQGSTIDDLEAFRRDTHEAVMDSLKTDRAFDELFEKWTAPAGEGPTPGSEEWLKHVFYAVSAYIPDPNNGARAFGTDVNHALLQKDGNSMLVLKAVLDRLGVANDVYLVRSAYQTPEVYPIRESYKYGDVLLRVVVPNSGDVVWLSPDGPDAMFNAVGPALVGQPALCATCIQPKREIVPEKGVRGQGQTVTATGKLDASGNLTGELQIEFQGVSAAALRAGLRTRTDDTSRAKFADVLAAGTFPGAAATSYRIDNELTPDKPLRIVVAFDRPGFAREVAQGVFAIETRMFAEPLASIYAPLPERTTPLFVSQSQEASQRFELDLGPWKDVQLAGQQGVVRLDSPFGNYVRETKLTGGKLVLDVKSAYPIQRVPIEQYPAFQKWALGVEQSSAFLVRLKK